jgi:hypothetical protein
MSATPSTVIAQLVETMRALAGPHPGFRPVHAKGIVCSGTFRGAPQALGVTRATHLQGQTVPTVIRFSNSSGDPDVHDGVANARAMAVKFQLPGGKNTNAGRARFETSEQDFRDAIRIARSISAKSLELRATMSLARLLASQSRRDEARVMLAELYRWFTEGFDTADLKEAKALLDELAT